MRPGLACAVLAALLAAGCISPPGPDEGTAKPTAAPVQEAGPPSNAFLLDTLRPPGSDLSDGAEPSILVDRLGRAIWVGDTSGLTVSFDNGTTWEAGASPFLMSADGWGLAQDDAG